MYKKEKIRFFFVIVLETGINSISPALSLHCFCKCELNNYLTISDDRFSGGQRIRCFMNIKTINKCT